MVDNIIKQDFSHEECEMLIRIISVKNSDDLTIQKLAKEIKVVANNVMFQKLIKYLISMNIIEISPKLYIYHKRLRDLIDEQFVVNVYYSYLNSEHLCHW